MMRFALLLTSILPLLAVGGSAVAALSPERWEIGPIIGARNYSEGMPLNPEPAADGVSFDIPYPNARAGHVHYLTFRHGSLAGKTHIKLRYRIDAARGAWIVARERPDTPATLSLYFQRSGDTWSGRGRYEIYRWYVMPDRMAPLTRGEHEITVPLDSGWKAVMATTAADNPAAFREALVNADRVGFALGSAGGRGHGVYATGPARFTILSFEVS